jgi:hypothetical protein
VSATIIILFLYPFSDLIKTKTLGFFSKTLPILKADDTLPKVARYEDRNIDYNPTIFHSRPDNKVSLYSHRTKRSPIRRLDDGSSSSSLAPEEKEGEEAKQEPAITIAKAADDFLSKHPRQGRAGAGWCDDSHGMFCMLFNAFRPESAEDGSSSSSSNGDGVGKVDDWSKKSPQK